MNDRIADTRQCPYCRQWIPMPLRRQREAFEAHKLQCRAEDAEAAGYPTFCASCHEPRNSVELNNAGTCHQCRAHLSDGEAATVWNARPEPERVRLVNEALDLGIHMHDVPTTPTVKRIDLFGNVIDTYRTETELNGFRASQGALL